MATELEELLDFLSSPSPPVSISTKPLKYSFLLKSFFIHQINYLVEICVVNNFLLKIPFCQINQLKCFYINNCNQMGFIQAMKKYSIFFVEHTVILRENSSCGKPFILSLIVSILEGFILGFFDSNEEMKGLYQVQASHLSW